MNENIKAKIGLLELKRIEYNEILSKKRGYRSPDNLRCVSHARNFIVKQIEKLNAKLHESKPNKKTNKGT